MKDLIWMMKAMDILKIIRCGGNQLNTTTPVDDQSSPNLQYRIRKSIVIQMPVKALHADGIVTGDQNSIRVNE